MNIRNIASPALALAAVFAIIQPASAFQNCSNGTGTALLNVNVTRTCTENTAVRGAFLGESAPRQVRAQLQTGQGGRAITTGLEANNSPVSGGCIAVDTVPGAGGQVITGPDKCDKAAEPLARIFFELQRP